MVYILVLFGSFLGICAILGARVLLRNRTVRKYVHSVKHRTQVAEDRGAVILEETIVEKPQKSPRASAIEMQEVRSLTRRAEKELAQQRFDDAEKLFIQALTVQPGAHDVQAQLAKLYLDTGREQKSEALYKDVLKYRQDASYYSNLGLAYYRQGKFKESCYAYEEALNQDPKSPDRNASLGRACIAAQRFQEAAPLLEKALERLARDTALLHLLAECYLQLGHTAKAEETYKRINKLEPYNEEVKVKLQELAKA